MKTSRFFLGFEACIPPLELPSSGRILRPESLHATIAFLGEKPINLDSCPPLPWKIGFGVHCDQMVFLPKTTPRVAAFHFSEWESQLATYQKEILSWLHPEKPMDFYPHITIARAPIEQDLWLSSFTPFPALLTHFHLYQSIGHLEYVPLQTYKVRLPFEEIEHTADIAYTIRGKNLKQLHRHAQIALSWRAPLFFHYFSHFQASCLEEIIIDLNDKLSLLDIEHGSPIKAISFHGDIIEKEPNLLEWEMLIDV